MLKALWNRLFPPTNAEVVAATPEPRRADFRSAIARAQSNMRPRKQYIYPIQNPRLPEGVVAAGGSAPALAMDSATPYGQAYAFATGAGYNGFPGYQYLAQLATRSEYRNMTSSLSTEMVREWITLNSSETAGDATKVKITELTQALKDHNIQGLMQKAFEHDGYYGRGQIFVDIVGKNRKLPLIIDPRAIPKGTHVRFKNVEPMWTTPNAYNAIDPAAPDFYKPTSWWMLGQQVHASRLLIVITREVPDMLKPAFNFSGISLSQLAEFYVDEWLTTKTSISQLLRNFSITALKTNMAAVLQGSVNPEQASIDAGSLIDRATLFSANRDNQGLMLLDNESEDLVQVNTPLSGLHELQAQALEHLCYPSRQPSVVLTGVSPSGLNASSDGEIRVFYDWISALQTSFGYEPIKIILQILQLSMYGEIDPDISFEFEPLYQMTPKELAEIRKSDADAATAYVNCGAIDGEEVRENLARDPKSGYQGLDMANTPNPVEDGNEE